MIKIKNDIIMRNYKNKKKKNVKNENDFKYYVLYMYKW